MELLMDPDISLTGIGMVQQHDFLRLTTFCCRSDVGEKLELSTTTGNPVYFCRNCDKRFDLVVPSTLSMKVIYLHKDGLSLHHFAAAWIQAWTGLQEVEVDISW